MKLKKWAQPELLIITRNRPEEAVLWLCKGNPNHVAIGPNTAELACRFWNDISDMCDTCESKRGS
jgi:hypothetical protein